MDNGYIRVLVLWVYRYYGYIGIMGYGLWVLLIIGISDLHVL